jgi:hypothetical protein
MIMATNKAATIHSTALLSEAGSGGSLAGAGRSNGEVIKGKCHLTSMTATLPSEFQTDGTPSAPLRDRQSEEEQCPAETKSKYTEKQKGQAEHIEEGYECYARVIEDVAEIRIGARRRFAAS